MSGRPRTPVGAHGKINVQEMEPGKWRARTLHRFGDGKRRQVERWDRSQARATNALKAALVDAATPSGEVIRRTTTIAVLADAYLKYKEDLNRAPRTIDTYRHNIDKIVKPRIGHMPIHEATTMRIQQFITTVEQEHGHGSAKGCRSVLSGMFSLAMRNDAITSNPVVGVAGIAKPRTKRGATALPVDKVPEFLAAIRADAELNRLDIVDLWEFMALTGCRIGEAIALRWEFVDAKKRTVTLGPSVSRVKGRGLVIRDLAKTDTSWRTIVVPQAAVDLLERRKATVIQTDLGLVFPSPLGNLRDTNNTEADWRANRDRLGWPGFTSHGFRKTVATALDSAGLSARDIAEYLGHKHPSMTQDIYMERNTQSTKVAGALNHMFGIKSE